MNEFKSIQELVRLTAESLEDMYRVDEMLGLVALGVAQVGRMVGRVMSRVMSRVMPRVVFRVVVQEKKESLILPPGAGLRDILHFIYPPKIAERVFDQIIADMQLEWQEAMIHEKKWLARWVRVRGILTVFLTAAVHVVATLGSIFKLVK